MDNLDQFFQKAYRDAKVRTRKTLGPVAVACEDRINLIWEENGLDHTWTLDLIDYHMLKSVTHLPLGLCLNLLPFTETLISVDVKEQLRLLQEEFKFLNNGLDPLPAEIRANQILVMGESIAWIQSILTSSAIFTRRELDNFLQKVQAPIQKNMEKAVGIHLNELNRVIQEAEELVRPDISDLKRELRVITMGPPQPREDALITQFFEEYLGVKNDRARLLYAENMESPKLALDLLCAVLVDRELALLFFGSEKRLEKDILGKVAERKLSNCPF